MIRDAPLPTSLCHPAALGHVRMCPLLISVVLCLNMLETFYIKNDPEMPGFDVKKIQCNIIGSKNVRELAH